MKKSISKISVNNHISMWQSMTERNRHSECAMDIAKYFGYKELWGAFKAIYNIHNQEGSLPYGVGRARYELVGYMLCKIEEDYGVEMREKISMCL